MKWMILHIAFLLAGSVAAHAQESATFSPMSMSPSAHMQWQLTVDVIKGKVHTLMEENTALTRQYQTTVDRSRKLQMSIARQEKDNAAIRKFLDERKGKTDQQLRIAEIEAEIKSDRARLPGVEQHVRSLEKQADTWVRKIREQRMKIDAAKKRQERPAVVDMPDFAADPELRRLRRDLEEQKKQEVLQERKLSEMDGQAVDPELKLLQDNVDALRKEKARLLKINSQRQNSTTNSRARYTAMVQQKLKLVAKVRELENQLNALKDPTAFGLGWGLERKKMVKEIVKADARNKQLRSMVNNLKEDIAVLREQVANRQKMVSYGGAAGNIR